MKRLLLATIITILTLFSVVVWISNASAQDRPQKLWGEVKYSGGGGVGALKPVIVNFEGEYSKSEYDTVPTDTFSHYKWYFYPPQYVYKVSCRFQDGGTWYSGETSINQELEEDTRVDITVYEE